jgi:hypothetical protein
MVITRTLDIDAAVSQLAYAAANLRRLAQDFDSLKGNETGLPELVKQLNMAVQQAGTARDDIEAAVDEYLNEGDDEYTDDEEDAEYEMYGSDDFPMSLEYDEGDE